MSDGMLVGVVFLLLGVVLTAINVIFVIFHKKKRKRCSVEIVATIVETLRYRKLGGNGHEHYYYAVYEYQYNGVTYKNKSKMGTNGCPKVGKLRTIYLNPENPEEYIEKRFLTYLHIVIMTVISGIFSFVGLMLILAAIF